MIWILMIDCLLMVLLSPAGNDVNTCLVSNTPRRVTQATDTIVCEFF